MKTIGLSSFVLGNDIGSSAPNGAPHDLSVVAKSDTEMTVTHQNGATVFDSTKYYYSLDGVTNWILGATIVGSGLTADITGLTENTTYYIKAVHYKGSKESAASNIVSATTQTWANYQIAVMNSVLADGNTVEEFDFKDNTNVVVDESLKVSQVTGLRNGKNFLQATSDLQPTKTVYGVKFNGSSEFLKVTMTMVQPIKIYAVFRICTPFGGTPAIFNSKTPTGVSLRLIGSSTTYREYAGITGATRDILYSLYYGVMSFLYNGSDSIIAKNNILGTKADTGAGGFTSLELGGSTVYSTYKNIEVTSMIFRSVSDSETIEKKIYDGLVAKYFDSLKSGAVIFSFDGDGAEIYNSLYPVLMSEGVAATVYVNGYQIDTNADWFTWTQILDMYNHGIDIQDHSQTHTHMSTQTTEQIQSELVYMNNLFTSHGLPEPKHIAYPFGDAQAPVQAAVAPYRLSGRSVENVVKSNVPELNYKNFETYHMTAINIDGLSSADIALFKTFIDAAKRNNQYLFFYGHGVVASIIQDAANLRELIQYSKSIGINTLNHSQLYDILHPA